MIQKIFAVLSVLGAAAWFGSDPRWEAGVVLIGTIGALVYTDRQYIDAVRAQASSSVVSDAPRSEHVDHDRDLFKRYDAILSERHLQNQFDGPLFQGRTSVGFVDALREYRALGKLSEGRFLDAMLQSMHARLLRHLDLINEFVAVNFFDLLNTSPDDDRLFLKPEIKYRDPESYYALHRTLTALIDEAQPALVAFRNEIKTRLAI